MFEPLGLRDGTELNLRECVEEAVSAAKPYGDDEVLVPMPNFLNMVRVLIEERHADDLREARGVDEA